MIEYNVRVFEPGDEGEPRTEWRVGGKLHREGGKPAVEFRNGTKYWYKNGLYHREDGPAVEYTDGFKSYFLEGMSISEKDFLERGKTTQIIKDLAEVAAKHGYSLVKK